MRQTQQAAARSHAQRGHLYARLARGLAVLLLGCVALPAWSATVKDVRVGRHPEFTRIVFELDEQAGYRVKRSSGDLIITVDAATKAWKLGRQGGIESVVVEAGDTQSVARIRLRQRGLRLQEMILANPPRIVLDLMHPPSAETAKPPAPQPAPAERRPAPQPVVKEPAAERVVEPAPAPAVKPPPMPAAKPRPEPPPAPSVAQPEPESSLEEDLLAPPPSFVKAVKPDKPEVEVEREPAKPPVAPPARVEPKPTKKKKVADASPGLLRNPMVIGAAAAVVIAVIALVVILRRRRAIPNDMDFEGMDDYESDVGSMSTDTGEAAEDDDFFGDLDSATASAEPAPPAPKSDGSIFDDDASTGAVSNARGDAKMSENLSGMQAGRGVGSSPASGAADIARVVQALEARVGALERKLEEANEARVRLERQVAAQSEELRVQRAAIARTQRALRSMSRSDDDKATEPALKDAAETQMKTRVNG